MTAEQLDAIELKKGSHQDPEAGMCFMEAVAYIKGLPHSDAPPCTDPVVAAYARALNDLMPDDQRQRLKPLILRAAETPNGVAPLKRAYLCADYAVRVFAAAALKDAGLDEWAEKLAGLPEIDSESAARSAASASARSAASARSSASASEASAAEAARSAASASARSAASASEASASAAARSAAEAARSAAAASAADPWAKPIELLEKLLDMHEDLA